MAGKPGKSGRPRGHGVVVTERIAYAKLRYADGATLAEIGRECGVTWQLIQRELKKSGVAFRNVGRQRGKESYMKSEILKVLELGRTMRAAQKQYFKTRSKDALIASRDLESAFDYEAERLFKEMGGNHG